MERHLSGHPSFSGPEYGLADIALYAYMHVADEGGLELAPYRALAQWMERVRKRPGHIPLSA